MNGYRYRCVARNDVGDATSNAVTLTVENPSAPPPPSSAGGGSAGGGAPSPLALLALAATLLLRRYRQAIVREP